MASPRKTRSKSPGRRRSTSRSTRSKSRSRSRSRGRTVRSKRSVTPSKASPPKSTKKPATPAAGKVKREERAVTPTRRSTRLENKTLAPEERKPLEFKMIEEPEKVRVGVTKSREFGGAIGSFFMIFGLPVTVLGLNILCSQNNCKLQVPKISTNWKKYFDKEAAMIYLGWFLFQAVLYMLPIGKVVEGQPLKSGSKLKYRCNGFIALIVSLLAFAVAVYYKYPVEMVHKKFLPLITTGIIFSVVLSVLLYIKARRGPNSNLAPGGNSGNILYDFFIGHELNPRIGSFDLKFFCELRPGLIGWLMINLVFLVEAYQKNNGVLPPALTMVVAFQALYVADALWFEDAILTTMDIIHDGFGFMLAFGDLVWVPFLYCLQTKYLAENNYNLDWYCLVAIGALNFAGYFMFRGSNSQKNDFRKNPYNPTLAHLESIPTSTGKRLLVSGWWGLCRKPNYLGDIIMSIAWSMPCDYQRFLADHCIQHKYLFQIRKCDSPTCCGPKRCKIDLPNMPDPVLSTDNAHYKKFEDVVGQQTTDKDRPSALNTTAVAVAEGLQGAKTSDLTGQNVRRTVACVECSKPRCIYAKKQLSVRDSRALGRLLEKYDYTCGSLITPDGFSTPIVWFYPIYFTILLIHRERRDEEACSKKYKASWDRYCERVKYRIFPKIY